MKVDQWPWKILWPDQAHFHLTGYINTLNCPIWVAENLLENQPVPLHPAKVTLWCGIKTLFIIRPYYFEETGASGLIAVTVIGQHYKYHLRIYVIPSLQQR